MFGSKEARRKPSISEVRDCTDLGSPCSMLRRLRVEVDRVLSKNNVAYPRRRVLDGTKREADYLKARCMRWQESEKSRRPNLPCHNLRDCLNNTLRRD